MTVQSIERAFSLLRALTTGPAGVTELADQVELPKSTVARLLGALEHEGAVAHVDGDSTYRLGDGLLDIAGAARPHRNLVATARPHLLALAESFGEAAGISIASGRQVTYLDHAIPDTDVLVRSWTGESLPQHTVPSGMALLAVATDADLDAYLDGPLDAATSYTLTDPDAVRERIELVRQLGYAWGYEEGVDGLNSVAAPVVLSDGSAVAAIHVHGPAYRFPNPDRTHDLGLEVVAAAQRIAESLEA